MQVFGNENKDSPCEYFGIDISVFLSAMETLKFDLGKKTLNINI